MLILEIIHVNIFRSSPPVPLHARRARVHACARTARLPVLGNCSVSTMISGCLVFSYVNVPNLVNQLPSRDSEVILRFSLR